VIIDEIHRLHATGIGVVAAVESVELIQQRGAQQLSHVCIGSGNLLTIYS
jgi:hypothetical protein